MGLTPWCWETSLSASLDPSDAKRRTIWRALDAHRIPRDGVLLVHRAFKQFALDGFSAEAVLDALCVYMEPGTLLLPTMSWRFVTPASPVFSELDTPSNTGVLTELFRTRRATHRSLHPTHSVAGVGREAAAILAFHHRGETPCHPESPFGLLAQADAHVLMFGIGMDCCTLIHHVEERIAPDLYVRPPEAAERYVCRDRRGRDHEMSLRRHLFLPRDYWQFQDVLAAEGRLDVRRVGNSISRHFRAVDMVDAVERTLTAKPAAIIAAPGQRFRMM